MTAAQFLDWMARPENEDAWCELSCGKMVAMARESAKHADIEGRLLRALARIIDGRRPIEITRPSGPPTIDIERVFGQR